MTAPREERSPAWFATITALSVIAAFIAGKAARDAIALASFDVTRLPLLFGASAFVSLPLVLFAGRLMTRIGPRRLVPVLNSLSAALLVVEWLLLPTVPQVAAALCFVHLSSLGAVLVSGFWSVVNERFDAQAAKRHIGRIGMGATVGGVVGGLIAERASVYLSASELLLVVAGLQVLAAIATHLLAGPPSPRETPEEPDLEATSVREVWRSPLLRTLAAMLVLGAVAAAALDYVFKAEVARDGADTLRIFAVYHTVVNVVTALVHLTLSRVVIRKVGVARSIGLLPLIATGAGALALLVPGMWVMMAARGSELVVRSSIFRASYELIYAPLPARLKRSSKVVLDVGAERVGDLLGSQLVALAIFLIPTPHGVVLAGAAIAGALGLSLAMQLPRRYSDALAESLVERQAELPARRIPTLAETGDLTTLSLIDLPAAKRPSALSITAGVSTSAMPAAPIATDQIAADIMVLRSRDPGRVRGVLAIDSSPLLAPFIVPLLGWDAVSGAATRALLARAPSCTGVLIDALLDPAQEFSIRRRLPSIIAAGNPELARMGLTRGLSDARFEVRYRCARALMRMVERDGIRHDLEPILERIRAELAVGSEVWRSHRLLDGLPEDSVDTPLQRILRRRSHLGVEHMFTLLGLALEPQPLQIALESLYAGDRSFRATGLEYLETVLPPDIRELVWPLVEASTEPPPGGSIELRNALVLSHPTIAAIKPDDKKPASRTAPSC